MVAKLAVNTVAILLVRTVARQDVKVVAKITAMQLVGSRVDQHVQPHVVNIVNEDARMVVEENAQAAEIVAQAIVMELVREIVNLDATKPLVRDAEDVLVLAHQHVVLAA